LHKKRDFLIELKLIQVFRIGLKLFFTSTEKLCGIYFFIKYFILLYFGAIRGGLKLEQARPIFSKIVKTLLPATAF